MAGKTDKAGKTAWITRTAIMIALLVVLQAATAPLASQLITGAAVNMALIVAVMTSGPGTGFAVAAVSPVAAKFFGVGPFWSLIPFIAAGNAALVLLWHLICTKSHIDKLVGKSLKNSLLAKARVNILVNYIMATMAGAAAKFTVLYAGVVRIAVPYMLRLPAGQAAAISAAFSVNALLTALAGGALASAVLPALNKALAATRR